MCVLRDECSLFCFFMKIVFVSLGCDKNLVDTEMMMGQLAEAGHEITNDESEADIAVVNTCSFISDAKEESIDTLISMGRLKEEGSLKGIIAAGCLAQRYSEDIRRDIPEVDEIVGTMAIDDIVAAVERLAEGKKETFIKPIDGPVICGKPRLVSTGGHFAYLKIAEGCDKRCSYCAIPFFRGKYRSVPKEVLVKEAKKLASDGVKELILVAQETTIYGVDLYKKKMLPELLRELSNIEGIEFIRLLYCYPEAIDDELIEEMKVNKKVCHYLDMPIQHASDRVLKRMGRLTNRAKLTELIGKLRREIPDICLRTTLITGFPGETGRDFKEMKEFVKDMRFDRLGVFTYSREEGTGAAEMSGQIPEFIKKMRRNSIMKLQQQIAFEKAEGEIGRSLKVMVEGRMPDESDSYKAVYACRTYKDAPEVDGFLFLETERELMTGDVVPVKVTASNKYDLIGVPDYEFTE